MRLPAGPGIRVDTGIAVGDVIPPDYDSMVAKVIAWGRDRPEALARLRCALRETTVVIAGGTTTKSFLLDLLDRPEVVSGDADTGWLDRTGAGGGADPDAARRHRAVQVAIDVYDAEEALERAAFLASARGGPAARHARRRPHHRARLPGPGLQADRRAGRPRPLPGRGSTAGDVDVDVDRLSEFESRLVVGGERFTGRRRRTRPRRTSSRWTASATGSSATRRASSAPRRPAVVVAVPVAVGDEVEAGATMAVLESMKMETAVRAPVAGRVREVLAVVNSQVDAGAPLLRVEPGRATRREEVVGERVTLAGCRRERRPAPTAARTGPARRRCRR